MLKIGRKKRSLPVVIFALTALSMLVATSAWLLLRSRERDQLLHGHIQSEQALAEAAAEGVAAILDGFGNDLDRLSRVRSVRYLSDSDRLPRTLNSFLGRSPVATLGLVRVDTTGRVLFLYPDRGLPEEAVEALRTSGYLAQAGSSERRLLSGPIPGPDGQHLVALSDHIHPDGRDPLGAIIALFPVSALAGPLRLPAQSVGRGAVLRHAGGTVLYQTGGDHIRETKPASQPSDESFVVRAAVASDVEPGIELELWSTRKAALAPLAASFGGELLLLLLMNGIICIGGIFLAREMWLQKRLGESMERRRQVERQLQEAQKLESIGRLAGGIAHDFNNALTAIQGSARLLEEELESDHPAREEVSAILQVSGHAADLTRQLLAFARRQTLRPRLVDLNGALRRIEPMLRRMLPEDVRVCVETASGSGWVHIDPVHLEQVILNLAINARDAMPQGGELRLSSEDVVVAEEPRRDGPGPGRYVRLTISDNGRGIPQEALPRVFEPFFTTKAVGEGTGLGLAVVYGIVTQSGGHIRVESSEGGGTRFVLDFAAAEAPQSGADPGADPGEDPPATPAGAPVPSAGATILLVEDNASVRRLAERCLARRGHRIVSAATGEEALRIVSDPALQIDLLLTDVVMPGMNGRELADRITAIRPDTPVLFMSGYMEDEVLQRGVARTGVRFLEKPFTPDDLVRRVETALAESLVPASRHVQSNAHHSAASS